MDIATTGTNFLDALAASLTRLLAGGLERLFGPDVYAPVLGPLSWADLGVFLGFLLVVLFVNRLAIFLLRRKVRRVETRPDSKEVQAHLFRTADKPLHLLIWICTLCLAAKPLLLKLSSAQEPHPVRQLFDRLFDLGVFVVLFWLFLRLTRILEARLAARAAKTKSKLEGLLGPVLGSALRVIVPVIGIIFALPVIGLPPEYAGVLAKGSSILIIGAVAWILFQVVSLGEKAVLAKYDITASDNLRARKVYTQIHVLSNALYVVIAIFTTASVLMLFEEARRFGTSLLASAGVIGIIVGFAAQRTTANLFAGFQLAMTQPIRLDDVVIVEGEWGRIEEITLTYVVLHIWDDRRLIVPLSYFIDKPFQNWTRASAELLGSVFIWVDYSLPLGKLRKAVQRIVQTSPLWDKRFWNLQVTDTTDHAMQLRVVATAADSSKAWDLRCEVREKLIGFVQKNLPQHLPRLRADLSRSGHLEPGGLPTNGARNHARRKRRENNQHEHEQSLR
ncbi:MAG: mechanosensitive ion channel family protein [Verrucomicrobiota bacterium]|jgi:small-conductance mechanosensitive channel